MHHVVVSKYKMNFMKGKVFDGILCGKSGELRIPISFLFLHPI